MLLKGGVPSTIGRSFIASIRASGVQQSTGMGNKLTVRLPKDLAEWLAEASGRRGIPQARIVRDALESARSGSFLDLAGTIRGPRSLSRRKGFGRV